MYYFLNTFFFFFFFPGESSVDLGESTESRKRRVRHLRSWNAISGDKDDGELPEDLRIKHEWQDGRRPSMVSVKNPANVLQHKERSNLVTQQRIVDLYAKHVHELKEVFDIHQHEPINLNQFLRGTQLAGVQIARSDAERLFHTMSSNGGGQGQQGQQGRLDSASFVKSLEARDAVNGGEGDLDPKGYKSYEQTADQRNHEYSTFGTPPPIRNAQSEAGSANMLAHKHYVSDPPSEKTTQWNNGDSIVRQERLASEKLLRTITDAADPHTGTRPSLTLQRAFAKVERVQDGFVDMTGFQEGMSNLGVQLSKQDCRELFRRFDASEQDTISIHSFTALVCDRQRTELLGSTQGLRLQSEQHDDHRILLDAWGVPSHQKMASEYAMSSSSSSSPSSSAGGFSRHSGIQAGRINNHTVEKDVRKRLRIISPQDPESARQYLLYVFRKHDSSGRGTSGTISHKAFRDALSNFDSTFSGSRAAAVVDICDNRKTGRINYHKFVDAVLNVDRAKHEQIPPTTGNEQMVRQNTANVQKKKERLDWSKHRWNNFQSNWVQKHGRSAVREIRTDAATPPSGPSWSSAPMHKQPFRVLHSSIRPPPSSPIVASKR